MSENRMSTSLAGAAAVAYAAVILALTTLKAFFRIGYLWDPQKQRVREVLPEPFQLLREAQSWFGPLFDYVGNVAFFVPLGMLLIVLLYRSSRPVLLATLTALVFSVCIELAQFAFELGRTSTDDVLSNTLGGFLGAAFALWCGPKWHKVWVWLALALAAVFAVLVGLGERLGDPNKVVDL